MTISQTSRKALASNFFNSGKPMSKIFEHIARENFRTSGYISLPRRERRSSWTFTAPPRSPFYTTNAVRDALQRRERAHLKAHSKPSFLQNCINVFLHR